MLAQAAAQSVISHAVLCRADASRTYAAQSYLLKLSQHGLGVRQGWLNVAQHGVLLVQLGLLLQVANLDAVAELQCALELLILSR